MVQHPRGEKNASVSAPRSGQTRRTWASQERSTSQERAKALLTTCLMRVERQCGRRERKPFASISKMPHLCAKKGQGKLIGSVNVRHRV